jgi:hypothetical protein
MPVMKEIKTPLALFNIHYFQDEKGVYYKKKGENHRTKIRPFWKMKRIVLGVPLMLLLVVGFFGYKIGMNLVSEKVMSELTSQMTKEDYEDILKDPSVQQIIDKEMSTDQLLNNVSSDPSIKDAISQSPVATNVNSSNEKSTPAANTDSSKEKSPAATNEDSSNGKDTPAANTDSSKDKDTVAGQDKTNEKQPSVEKTEPKLQFNSRTEVMKFLLSKFSMAELRGLSKKAEGGVTAQEKAEIKSTVLGRLSTEEYNAVKVFAVVEISKGQ